MATGKKYGLIISSKKGTTATKKVKKPSIFDESSDEEESGFSGKFWKENKKRSKQIKSHESVTKALAEDPSIFEYDSVYDEMQQKKKKADPRLQKKDTKPKYIYQLKKMAEKRKLEQEIVYERKVQRDMESEGGDFEDKDTFVTSAYRKKLEERRKMEEELLKEDAIEAANDVRKQKDLSKFHRNLLNQITTSSHPSNDEDSKARSIDKQQTRERERQKTNETSNQEHQHRNDDRTPNRERRLSDSPERRASMDSKSSKPRQQSTTSEKERSPTAVDKPQEELATATVDYNSEQTDDQETEIKTVKLPTKEDLEEKRRVVAAKRTNTEAMESAKERYLARKRAKLSIPVVVQDD